MVLVAVFHKNTPNTECPALGVHITNCHPLPDVPLKCLPSLSPSSCSSGVDLGEVLLARKLPPPAYFRFLPSRHLYMLAHVQQRVLFQTGDLRLRNVYFLCNLHLSLSLIKTHFDDALLPLRELF